MASGICDQYLNCEERQFDRGDCVILGEGDTCNQISDMCGDGLSCDGQTLTCTDTDGCDGTECGEGATCTDAAAPDTGYSCSCGTGYEGATTTNGAAACTAAANDTPTDQTTTQQSTTAPAPSNTVSSAFNARVAVWLPIAVATVIATTQ